MVVYVKLHGELDHRSISVQDKAPEEANYPDHHVGIEGEDQQIVVNISELLLVEILLRDPNVVNHCNREDDDHYDVIIEVKSLETSIVSIVLPLGYIRSPKVLRIHLVCICVSHSTHSLVYLFYFLAMLNIF